MTKTTGGSPIAFVVSLFLIGGGLGLSLFFVLTNTEEKPLLVVLEPNVYVHNIPVLEGEKVTVPLRIVNKTSKTIHVQKITASCGCTTLQADDAQPSTPPFEVKSSEYVLFNAVIDSEGIEGDRDVRLAVSYTISGKKGAAIGGMRIHVYPALRCLQMPQTIQDEADGEMVTGTFLIGDAFPESGIVVDTVTSDLPEIVHCQIRELDRNAAEKPFVPDNSAADSLNWINHFSNRYAVDFSFTRENDPFEKIITVASNDGKSKALYIPIHYAGSAAKPILFPSKITLAADHPPQENRIEIRITENKNLPIESLTVESKPEFLRVESIVKTNDCWLVTLNVLDIPDEQTEYSVIFYNGSGCRLAEIPVCVLDSNSNSVN